MEFIDLEKPKIKEKTNLQLLSGKDVPDIKIFSLVSEDDFELMTEQWLFSMKDRYKYVKRIGASGDQGRDIFAYQDENMTILDIYQCKHYNNKLTPSNIYVEIGKLLYYTYNQEYVVPKNYYIISSKGCGTALTKLIENPEKFKSAIIQNWNNNCKSTITKEKSIELNTEFETFIKNFDFSIINEITPLNFLEEFEKTKYYSSWFGLRKFKRKTPPEPSNIIENNELTYVNKLYRAYGSVNKSSITNFKQLSNKYQEHFSIQRKCFYSAEGLKEFSRDSLPTDETFNDLQNQIMDPVKSQILCNTYKNGVECLNSAIAVATTLNIGNNSLSEFLKTNDRIGILHQVANEDESIEWTEHE
ncbi:restriction endonuclease [bacterium]|nr:restriction endonuclease [bacterium]